MNQFFDYDNKVFRILGGFALIKNRILEKVFRKYRTPEDLKRELEMTREYLN